MDDVVVCECGAKIRRPPSGAGTAFRCPRCRAVIANVSMPAERDIGEYALAPASPFSNAIGGASVDSARAPAGAPPASLPGGGAVAPPRVAPVKPGPPGHRASEKEIGSMCPICQSSIGDGDVCVACPACNQTHHQECWMEVGGCATYGCKEAPAQEKRTEPQEPLTAWGDNKSCPVCGERIKSIAIKCRYCGTDFGTVDPLSRHDLHARLDREKAQKSLRNSAVTLFVCSVLGVLAPLMAIVSLCWVLPKRKALAKAGPVYLILGYSSLGLSVIYSLLMLLFCLT